MWLFQSTDSVSISALVWNLSVICLELVLFHPISIRTNILGAKSLRTCPEYTCFLFSCTLHNSKISLKSVTDTSGTFLVRRSQNVAIC